MKSLKKFIALPFVFAISFTLFAAAPKVDYAALSEKFTPENSVVMIFFQQNDFDMYQMNPEYAQNKIVLKQSDGCTTPMEPGSNYLIFVKDVTGSTNWIGTPSIPATLPLPYLNYAKSTFFSGSRITVPTKPGLYLQFFAIENDEKSQNATLEDYKKSKIARNFILSRLKKTAKLYAGTAWEPLINEHVEEWSK